MTSTEERSLEVLDEDECRRLLPTAAIGRLAFTEGALPAIQPVSFGVAGNQIVIPTRVGSKVAAATRGAIVAFEVDAIDTAKTARVARLVFYLTYQVAQDTDVPKWDRRGLEEVRRLTRP